MRKDGHGLTRAQAGALARDVAEEGFTGVAATTGRAGRRTLAIVQAVRDGDT